ncbi:MAG: DUF72 domain-containing protein [Deltaproteobacteria bacterium]|nr:DUF72 domain-containing protein [Deltaproteobacteria bacterium]
MTNEIQRFMFRKIHPMVFLGTASDRYAGWIGQIYPEERYRSKITRRTKTVGKQTVTEEVLPVESVTEYFRHFAVLELDFTFYSLLLDKDLEPTQTYRVLETYQKHLRENDGLILKVPQVLFAKKIWRGGSFTDNPGYLNAETFVSRFYEPAMKLLGDSIKAFLFEQEYQAKKERVEPGRFAESLDAFFRLIPRDERYHTEVRTESLLSKSYFEVLEEHGVGQVLSHWTWLPPLQKQFQKGGESFFSKSAQCVVRLMTPRNVRYEEAFIKAFPFDRLIDGMMSPGMVEDTVAIMKAAIDQGVHANVIINNRAGGNAPLIAQRVAENFLQHKAL